MDPRYNELAEVLTGFSTKLKAGEHVLIDAQDVPEDMVVALIRAARKRKAIPHVLIQRARVTRELLKEGNGTEYSSWNSIEMGRIKKMDAYIALRGSNNIFEMSDVAPERMKEAMKALKPA